MAIVEIVDFPINSMVIFHSYFDITREGKSHLIIVSESLNFRGKMYHLFLMKSLESKFLC